MPRHCSADSPPLCDTVQHGQQPPRGTVPPTPVRPAHRTLEKGRRNPRREDARLLCARTGRRRDVRPVGVVTSVVIGPVRPSPPPRHHPRHCNTIPDVVGVRGDKTPPRWLLCPLWPPVSCTLESAHGQRLNGRFQHRHPRSRPWTDTGHSTTLRQSKIRQDGHLLCDTVCHTATHS
jgi:hypothetical protein